MVRYIGSVPIFHIQINWNFTSTAVAFLLHCSHICRCITDPNKICLCSNMFYC